jgi:hypothetical protein
MKLQPFPSPVPSTRVRGARRPRLAEDVSQRTYKGGEGRCMGSGNIMPVRTAKILAFYPRERPRDGVSTQAHSTSSSIPTIDVKRFPSPIPDVSQMSIFLHKCLPIIKNILKYQMFQAQCKSPTKNERDIKPSMVFW